MKESLVKHGINAAKVFGYAAVITIALIIAFSGQTRQTNQVQLDTRNGVLATACVLSLPVEPTGRDPQLVGLCFTQYGLQPPALHNP
jgi:hypothetical protein